MPFEYELSDDSPWIALEYIATMGAFVCHMKQVAGAHLASDLRSIENALGSIRAW